jgi:hypothetical protein
METQTKKTKAAAVVTKEDWLEVKKRYIFFLLFFCTPFLGTKKASGSREGARQAYKR